MAKSNTELIINSATQHITNINKCLKNIKSDIFADFIYISNNRVTIMMNKPANIFNLRTIEKYIKNINSDSIKSPQLSKSKSYLKIVGLPYKMEQGLITSEIIESICKESYLFEDIVLASKLHVIKASPKSDMTFFFFLNQQFITWCA